MQMLHMFVWVVALCEQSPDGRLWKSLGVQRLNLHVVMDYVSRYVTKEAMSEDLIRFLFEEMVGSKQIEENGREWDGAVIVVDNLTMKRMVLLFGSMLSMVNC